MHRRDFFKFSLAGAGLLGSTGLSGLAAATRAPRPRVVIIADVSPDVSAAHLDAVLAAILAQAQPVACVVNAIDAAGVTMDHSHPVAQVLRRHARQAPWIFQIIAYHAGLARLTPYFQARAAFDTRASLMRALAPPEDGTYPAFVLNGIACAHDAAPLAPDGLRAAGFRNVLIVPEQTSRVIAENWDNGTLRLIGGARDDIFASTQTASQTPPDQFLDIRYLSAPSFERDTAKAAGLSAAIFANMASEREMEGEITVLRLPDIQIRDDFQFSRLVGLHLFAPDGQDALLDQGFERMKADLAEAGIAFSHGPLAEPAAADVTARFWVAATAPGEAPHGSVDLTPVAAASLDCSGEKSASPSAVHAMPEAGIGVVLPVIPNGGPGIDSCGFLRVPSFRIEDMLDRDSEAYQRALSMSEFAITVSADQLKTPAQRSVIRKHLEAIDTDEVSALVPLDTLARAQVPQSRLLSRFRQVQAWRPNAAPVARRLTDPARQALLDDAALAWSYIETLTNPATGLCPATVFLTPGGKSVHASVTMWDVASHINGLIAAADIGFLTKEAFRTRIGKIIPNIAGRESYGRTLPQEWIKTDRHRWGNRNFDACDTGRLLGALANLSRHPFSESDVDALVQSWDLDKVVIEGEIHSVLNRELVSIYKTPCAHYSALALRHWGVQARSPFEVMQGVSAADGEMALLHAANRIGPVGAEPLLLEALDFGLSRESSYLAEALFSAQLAEYEQTGILTCVSESPIDREPWFTYQGLILDAERDIWAVTPTKDRPEFNTQEFARANRAVSSKAAYLWAAHNPHFYSDKLLDYVREHGKTGFGIASSIYTSTGTATADYSDLNTNGIILQAIAAILARG